MDTIIQRSEKFQELFKEYQVLQGDTHKCENCDARRKSQIEMIKTNTEEFEDLLVLPEDKHWNIIRKVTISQISLIESKMSQNPVQQLLSGLMNGDINIPGLGVEVVSSADFERMKSSTESPIPSKGGQTHC